LCGNTCIGHAVKPSENFTAWAQCYHGTVLCPECHAALKTPELRRSSWLLTQERIIYLQQEQPRALLREFLSAPPAVPFAVYLTRGGQKQGWLALMRYVNWSAMSFWVGMDWRDKPALLTTDYVVWSLRALVRLRQRLSRAKLLGEEEVTVSDYAWLEANNLLDHWHVVRQQRGDPRWEVMVYAAD
jgi:hypothetical protein